MVAARTARIVQVIDDKDAGLTVIILISEMLAIRRL